MLYAQSLVGSLLASRPSKPPRAVPVNAAMFVDGILGTDVLNYLLSSDVTVLFQGAGDSSFPAETRLLVGIVPHLRRETYVIWPEAVVEQCEQHGTEAALREVPWFSDCLASCSCPPAIDVLAETMRDAPGN